MGFRFNWTLPWNHYQHCIFCSNFCHLHIHLRIRKRSFASYFSKSNFWLFSLQLSSSFVLSCTHTQMYICFHPLILFVYILYGNEAGMEENKWANNSWNSSSGNDNLLSCLFLFALRIMSLVFLKSYLFLFCRSTTLLLIVSQVVVQVLLLLLFLLLVSI